MVGIGLRYLGWLVEPETCGRLPPGIFLCDGAVSCSASRDLWRRERVRFLADSISTRKTETRHPRWRRALSRSDGLKARTIASAPYALTRSLTVAVSGSV